MGLDANSFIEGSYEGGSFGDGFWNMVKDHSSGLLVLALVLVIVCLIWLAGLTGGVIAMPKSERLSSPLTTGAWSSRVNIAGVEQDTEAVRNRNDLERFVGTYKGKYYSDDPTDPNRTLPIPNSNGKYQSDNENAPGFFPSAQMLVDAEVKARNDAVTASKLLNYRIGRIDMGDCLNMAEIEKRQSQSAYDWQYNQIKDTVGPEYMVPERYVERAVATNDIQFSGSTLARELSGN